MRDPMPAGYRKGVSVRTNPASQPEPGTVRMSIDPRRPENAAFREHASGLIVPTELSRGREVWSKDEWRLLDRATKMLASHKMDLFLACSEPACKKAGPIERLRRNDGGITLRCEHLDREVHKL